MTRHQINAEWSGESTDYDAVSDLVIDVMVDAGLSAETTDRYGHETSDHVQSGLLVAAGRSMELRQWLESKLRRSKRVLPEEQLERSVWAINAIIQKFSPNPKATGLVQRETVRLIETWTIETWTDNRKEIETDWSEVLKIMSLILSDGLQFGNWPWNTPRRKVG